MEMCFQQICEYNLDHRKRLQIFLILSYESYPQSKTGYIREVYFKRLGAHTRSGLPLQSIELMASIRASTRVY